ncbi:MAG: ABC transporter permease [Propionibacteriaceae bacterium]|jgi:hypothetical protein|nr:ABC transporter permease [Propionibacteriaceae bacterium]
MKHWSLSRHGVKTVAALELRQRVRSRRWLAALIAWFVVLGGVTLLIVNLADYTGPASGRAGDEVSWCDGATCYLPEDGTGLPTVCTVARDGAIDCEPNPEWRTCWDSLGDWVSCPDLTEAQLRAKWQTVCESQDDGSVLCRLPGEDRQLDIECTVHPNRTYSCHGLPLDGWLPSNGPLVFSLVTLFVLLLGLLVTPALTATSINGDRHEGTLATLQATQLSAAEIAAGKLVAAWLTVLAFLVAALPWLATGMVIGSIDLLQVVVCFAVLLVELAVVCAVGLGWSALVNRTSGSGLLTYATVLALSVLTLVAFVLAVPLIANRPHDLRTYSLPADVYENWNRAAVADPDAPAPLDHCRWETERGTVWRTDHIWWILAANPAVIVADAAPEPAIARRHPAVYSTYSNEGDLLSLIRQSVREARDAPVTEWAEYPCVLPDDPAETAGPGPVWPWGLGFSLLLGGFFFWVTVRRLSVPYGALPKGTRVA